MGIQTSSADPTNPIPPDSVSGLYPGGYVTAGSQLELVGNNGTANAIQISSPVRAPICRHRRHPAAKHHIALSTTQTAQGESTSADLVAYDSLGMPLSVRITCVLQESTSSYTEYRWFADCGNNDPASGAEHRRRHGVGRVRRDGQLPFRHQRNRLHPAHPRTLDQADAVPIEFQQRLRPVHEHGQPRGQLPGRLGAGDALQLPDRPGRRDQRSVQQRHHPRIDAKSRIRGPFLTR